MDKILPRILFPLVLVCSIGCVALFATIHYYLVLAWPSTEGIVEPENVIDYSVNGVTYQLNAVKNYRAGEKVEIYYNPDAPYSAALTQPREDWLQSLLRWSLALMILITLYIIITGLRSIKTGQPLTQSAHHP